MAKIFVFRHGESEDNKNQIFSGLRDPDLTAQGEKETEKIAQALKNEKITKAYASDQLRSKRSLEIVLKYHPNVPVFIDPRIKERDYGDLTGKNKIEIAQKFPDQYPLWHRSYDVPPPNGESIKDVEVRVLSFLNELLPTLKKDDVILISAHGNSIRPIRRFFEKIPIGEMVSFEHEPGRIYEYQAP